MSFIVSKIKTYLLLGAFAALPISVHASFDTPIGAAFYSKRLSHPSYRNSPSYYSPSVALPPSVQINPTVPTEIALLDLTELTDEQLFEGYLDQQDTSFIVRCNAGTQLVIDFELNSPYFHIGDQSGNGNFIAFTVDKTFYTCNLWVEESSTYFDNDDEILRTEYYVETFYSDDMETWKTAEKFFGFTIDLRCTKVANNTMFFSFVEQPIDQTP